MTERDYFDQQRATFSTALIRLAIVSNSIAARFVHARFGWASWIYARMGLAGHSVEVLLQSYIDDRTHTTLDHTTVGNACRSILEMQILIGYLVEDGLSEEEWLLRKWALDIHDCNSRVRLFRSLSLRAEKEDFKKQRQELQERIRTNPLFSDLPDDTQMEIITGKRIYVRGMRAALTLADWQQDRWDGIYAYLSGSAHASPISFYRGEERGIDNLSVTPYQFSFAGFALELSAQAIEWANDRVAKVFSELADLPRPEGN